MGRISDYFVQKKIIFFIVGWLSVLVLTVNILWLHSWVLGMPLSILFFLSFAYILSKKLTLRSMDGFFLGGITFFTIFILFNLFYLYFFTLNEWSVALSIFITASVASFFYFFLHYCNDIVAFQKKNEERALFPKINIIYPFIFALLIAQVFILLAIRSNGHIYHGFIPRLEILSPWLMGVSFFLLFILVFSSLRVKYIIFSTLCLYLISSAVYVIVFQDLYGADPWRHLAIENFVGLGNEYKPTDVIELLSLKSEKLPNASLYTIIPSLHYVSQLPIDFIHKYFSLLMLAPAFFLILFLIGRDLFGNNRAASVFTFGMLISPATLYIAQYTSVQGVGIFYFTVNLWIWIRYLLNKDQPLQLYHFIITPLAIIAYPTTGYFSLIVVSLAVLIKYFKNFFSKINPIFYTVPLSFFIALPIPVLDIYLKSVKIDQSYGANWISVFSIFKDWFQTVSPIFYDNPGLTPFIFLVVINGTVWLYKKNKHLFIFLIVVFLSTQIAQWSYFMFDDKGILPVFSGRVGNLAFIMYYFFAALGVCAIINKILLSKSRILLLLIGVIISFHFSQITNIYATTFGWSVSQAEAESIDYVKNDSDGQSYIVLTDEVTSAAGSAKTNLGTSYYWYPGGPVYELYVKLLKSPSESLLQDGCRNFDVNKIYFISAPIPLTVSYPENLDKIGRIMDKIWNRGKVDIYEHKCDK